MERLKVAPPKGKKKNLLDEIDQDEENLSLEDLEEPSVKQNIRKSDV